MRHGLRILAATAVLALAAAPAHAMVTISSAATQNMSCSGGICTPTAKSALLNVGDLETLLASGNVEVTTTGTGVQARDIDVKGAFGWSGSSVLTLVAYRSIAIDQPVSVTGLAGMALDTSDGNKGKGGSLSFGKSGNVTFANLASSLAINDAAYTLVGDIKRLASDIAANPKGDFALASSYDAGADGTYNGSVVPTEYFGTFTGLGNTISNLSIVGQNEKNVGNGLFALVGATGALENVGLVNASIVATVNVKYLAAGLLAGGSYGTIQFTHATGSVTVGRYSTGGGLVGTNAGIVADSYAKADTAGKGAEIWIGGLVGDNTPTGTIADSHASGTSTLNNGNFNSAGGLVGRNDGAVETSYATGTTKGSNVQFAYEAGHLGGLVGTNDGPVTSSYASGAVSGGDYAEVGGLVGQNDFHNEGPVTSSYASGPVSGGNYSEVGGLVGQNDVNSTIDASYSTGAVTGGETGSIVGGLIGYDSAQAGSLSDTYWDTDTSGVANLSQGAGNIANDPGITGLTTEQFQSGLPQGFDPSVWAENPNIDGGLPYLIANPPPK